MIWLLSKAEALDATKGFVDYLRFLFRIRIDSHVFDTVEHDTQVETRRPVFLLDQHVFTIVALDVKGVRWQFFAQDKSHNFCDGILRLVRRHRDVNRKGFTTFGAKFEDDFAVGM